MISLITNETCFVVKSVHIWQCIARIKCLFKIWAYEAIQYELSMMDRKQNIWQNIATKVYYGGYTRAALQCCFLDKRLKALLRRMA